MYWLHRLVVLAAVACGSTFVPSAFAQKADKKDDTKKADAKDAAKDSKSKDTAKAVRHALPRYYKDIVDDTQKEKIYKIQDSYADEIHKIQDQLDAVKAKRDAEIRGVLTKAQQAKLDAMMTDDKKDESSTDAKMEKKDSKAK